MLEISLYNFWWLVAGSMVLGAMLGAALIIRYTTKVLKESNDLMQEMLEYFKSVRK